MGYGDLCKHAHVSQPNPLIGFGTAMTMGTGGISSPADLGKGAGGKAGPAPRSSGEICQFFVKSGWCQWGDACRHVHTLDGITQVAASMAPVKSPLSTAEPMGGLQSLGNQSE